MLSFRLTAGFLVLRNRQHAIVRTSMGKTIVATDVSLEKHGHYVSHVDASNGVRNDQAFDDLTDTQNEDFIFVL